MPLASFSRQKQTRYTINRIETIFFYIYQWKLIITPCITPSTAGTCSLDNKRSCLTQSTIKMKSVYMPEMLIRDVQVQLHSFLTPGKLEVSGKLDVPAALLLGKDPCTNYIGAGWGTQLIWQYRVGLKIYSVAGIWSLGFPA